MATPLLKADYLRSLAIEYARHFIGVPYHWGGDDPLEGFDCSGFVIEVLQAVGVLPHNQDYTAHDLWTIFKPAEVARGYAGCLAFWFDNFSRAVHVMICIDSDLVIGAAGGGSSTVTIKNAISANAYIKMRPLSYRKDICRIVDPFKGGI